MELFNAFIRICYIIAYRIALLFYFITKSATQGACVAVWCDSKVLLIRNSYRKAFSFPGGFVAKGEDERETAARELLEETGLAIPPDHLEFVLRKSFFYECKNDSSALYTVSLKQSPLIKINHREVVWADFMTPSEALKLELCPHARAYLEKLQQVKKAQ